MNETTQNQVGKNRSSSSKIAPKKTIPLAGMKALAQKAGLSSALVNYPIKDADAGPRDLARLRSLDKLAVLAVQKNIKIPFELSNLALFYKYADDPCAKVRKIPAKLKICTQNLPEARRIAEKLVSQTRYVLAEKQKLAADISVTCTKMKICYPGAGIGESWDSPWLIRAVTPISVVPQTRVPRAVSCELLNFSKQECADYGGDDYVVMGDLVQFVPGMQPISEVSKFVSCRKVELRLVQEELQLQKAVRRKIVCTVQ